MKIYLVLYARNFFNVTLRNNVTQWLLVLKIICKKNILIKKLKHVKYFYHRNHSKTNFQFKIIRSTPTRYIKHNLFMAREGTQKKFVC